MKKRTAKPGKFAGRSLHMTAPARPENMGNIGDALTAHEQEALAILAAAGYSDDEALPDIRHAARAARDTWKGGRNGRDFDARKHPAKHWTLALDVRNKDDGRADYHESPQSAARRAAQSLLALRDCRRALVAGNAEAAAWAAYVLADINNRNKLDNFAEPVLRDRARQAGNPKGGRNKRQSAVPAWKAATKAAVKACGRECSAKDAWRWLANSSTPVEDGFVTMDGDVLTFDGSDATLTFNGWRRYLTEALAKANLRSK